MSRKPRWRKPVRTGQGMIRSAGRVLTTLFVLIAVAGGWVVWTYGGPGPAARQGAVTDVILPKGAGVGQIASALKAAGVIGSKEVFYLAAKLGGSGRRLKAGEYEFKSGASMASVLGDIANGRVVRRFVVAPEGWTSAMVADAVRAQPVLTGEIETPPEGSILPDGYQIQRGEDRGEVMARMMAARDALLTQLWAARAPDLPLKTPEEAVTLASIVEKETGVPAERPRIAAVFENRLRAGMKLESDPTTIYGITRGRPLGRPLTHNEVVTPGPYTTYSIVGLPPTPIANPGRAALEAVLNPPKSDELYFVANGTGGHSFASTYAAHVANVDKWREIRRRQTAAGGGQ
ncbi:MAG: endolytic transglycosylase MltG [Caulobacteraceae bacterium]